jgi:hypothetical protein
MRGLIRNQTKFYYALYEKREEIIDEYGNKTGQYELIYGNPVMMFGNVSAAVGEIQNRQFGESESYDKVIVLNNPNISINEYSHLWVDTPPLLTETGTLVLKDDGTEQTPHDYVVKKIARSLNSVSIAIQKVDVNG